MLKKVEKIPGGIMLVPMVIMMTIRTFLPSIFALGDPFNALFSSEGTITFVGLLLFFSGTQLDVKNVKQGLKIGGIIVSVKIVLSVVISFIILHYLGDDDFLGVSAIALVVGVMSVNPGLFIALIPNSNDNIDLTIYGLINLISVPALPILIINSSKGQVDWLNLLSTVIPFLLGLFLGNFDSGFKQMYASGTKMILPFFGFCLGAAIDIPTVLRNLPADMVILLIYFIVNTLPLILIENRIFNRNGYSSCAFSGVAGLSIAIPSMLMSSFIGKEEVLILATGQLASGSFLSFLIVPWLTNLFMKGCRENEDLRC